MSATIPKTKSIIGKEYASEVLNAIESALVSVDILMFEWRWYDNDMGNPIQLINQAIVRAVRRGVKVRALTWKMDICKKLQSVGVEAMAWPLKKLMHSKIIVIDGFAVIMGSHNLTSSAIHTNIETSVILYDREIAKIKIDYINNLWLS